MRLLVISVLLLQVAAISSAQYHDNLMFGLKIGTNYSLLTNLPNILVNEENKPLYKFSEKSDFLPSVSLFSHYRFPDTQIAFDGRISFYQIGSEVEKRFLVSSTVETYNISYQYLAIGIYTKVYLYRGFNFGIGANIGSCLNTSSGITYKSTVGTVAQHMQSQEQIRQTLKGRANINAGVIIGYEFKFGLSVEASYFYGLTDIIETNVNPYNFAESKNHPRSFQFTLGWAISKDGFYF